ncbi:MAG TPA: hypothetical protein ENK31_05980 [Nannocystis exedens]|nr:hypothetical protein [Nannocystis exedens]
MSETRSEVKGEHVGAAAELRVGFRSADALYVSSPSAWTEQIKGLARAVRPLSGNPQWRPEWMVVTRLYHASQAIILLSNSDNADVRLNLNADGVALSGDSANDIGEQGSVALQLTGVRGPLFMGLHWVHKDLEDVVPRRRLVNRVLVLGGIGLVASGALTSWLVVAGIRQPQAQKVAMLDGRESADRPAAFPQVEEQPGGGGDDERGMSPGLETTENSVPVHFKTNRPALIVGSDGGVLGHTDDASGIQVPEGEPVVVALVAKGFETEMVEVRPKKNGVVRATIAKRPVLAPPPLIAVEGSTCERDGWCLGDLRCIAGRCVAVGEHSAVTTTSGTGSSGTTGGTTGSTSAAETSESTGQTSSGGEGWTSGGSESSTGETASPSAGVIEGPVGDDPLPRAEGVSELPVLLWGTLSLAFLGLLLVFMWLVRRFLAPLEPVRPEDIDG